jgi:uncharacterized heparinase superfamily protein
LVAPSTAPATIADLSGLAVRRLGRRALGAVALSLWRRPVAAIPSRILFAPETLLEADPAVAADVYAGVFALAGEVVDAAGRSPFAVPPPTEEWARALHGFEWLVHLEANASELSSSNARALVDEWLMAPSLPVKDAPAVAAARLTTWLVEAPLLLNGADAGFKGRFLRAVGRHLRRLERAFVLLPPGLVRLKVVAALGLAGTVVADEGRLQRWSLGALADVLESEVLPDGGHASRSPEALAEVLAALVPLREALVRRQQPVPAPLRDAIDRMLPMLRFFRHGDGGLARFHGSGVVGRSLVDALLAFDDAHGAPAANARYSGYQRLEAGGTAVIVDTGPAPPPDFAARACASALSFEMSHEGSRIVVNCGALDRARGEWEGAARATAAHSTLTLADRSSARVLGRFPLDDILGPVLYAGPRAVEVQRAPLAVRGSHDGYRPAFGLVHERALTLSDDGLALSGEDRLVGGDRVDGRTFAIRFHLDPAVKVRVERRRRRALLTLPDGSIWIFTVVEGPELLTEDTVVLVGPRRVRRSVQIVIPGNTLTDGTVRWHIGRHAAALDGAPSDTDRDR